MGLCSGSRDRGHPRVRRPPPYRYFVWTLVGRLRGLGGPEDPHSWPLLAYLLTCCIYPLASSCAHTFSTMSNRARHICYFFDYAALSMYSLGKGGQGFGGGASPSTAPGQQGLEHREV